MLGLTPLDQRIMESLQLARTAEQDNQPALAANRLAGLLSFRPWDVGMAERVGRNYLLAGEYEQATAHLALAYQRGQLSRIGQLQLVELYLQSQNYAQAAPLLENLAIAAPEASTYQQLSDVYRVLGDWKQSLEAARKLRVAAPGQAAAAYRLAILLAAAAPDESVQEMKAAARLEARYQPAADTFTQAAGLAKLSDDPAYRLTVMGRALAGLPEWDLAQAAFTQAVEQNPAYAEAWALLGEAMAQNGGDGSAALRRAVEINPDSVLSRALLALNLARRMEWDGAIEHMQAAARLEPQRAVWRIELGNFYAQQGDVNQAFEEYQIAARIAPRELDVWLALGNFSLIYGFSVEDVGLPAAKRAVEIGEESAAAFNLLGAVQWELGDDVQAEENLKKALELEPSYVRANLNLGNLYLKQGLTNQALEQYAAAVSLDPHGEVGQMAQRMIDRYFSDSQP